MLNVWIPAGLWAVAVLVVLLLLLWACVVVSYERRADREWQEQQRQLTEERAEDLANDQEWACLLDWVKKLQPVYPDPDDD